VTNTKQLLFFGLLFSIYLFFFTVHLVKEAAKIDALYDSAALLQKGLPEENIEI